MRAGELDRRHVGVPLDGTDVLDVSLVGIDGDALDGLAEGALA